MSASRQICRVWAWRIGEGDETMGSMFASGTPPDKPAFRTEAWHQMRLQSADLAGALAI